MSCADIIKAWPKGTRPPAKLYTDNPEAYLRVQKMIRIMPELDGYDPDSRSEEVEIMKDFTKSFEDEIIRCPMMKLEPVVLDSSDSESEPSELIEHRNENREGHGFASVQVCLR